MLIYIDLLKKLGFQVEYKKELENIKKNIERLEKENLKECDEFFGIAIDKDFNNKRIAELKEKLNTYIFI